MNLSSNLATAYQTPTTVQLSNRPSDEGGFNEDLGPEDLRSFEVGARGSIADWRVRFEVAGYFSTIDGALVRFQRADAQAYTQRADQPLAGGDAVIAFALP
ncbi:MAG: TonB-dependent receptor [Acidobacteria bacterium]|nr:TonB-dependent receptor [Acidobacteriota bacterium]